MGEAGKENRDGGGKIVLGEDINVGGEEVLGEREEWGRYILQVEEGG